MSEIIEQVDDFENYKNGLSNKEVILLEELKSRVRDESQLIIPPAEEYMLIRCLRSKNYNLEDALRVAHRHFEFKIDVIKMTPKFQPSQVEHVFQNKLLFTCGSRKDSKGRLILIICPEYWEPEIEKYEDLLPASLFISDELSKSEETQHNGVILIVDFQNLALKHIRQCTPYRIHYVTRIAQDSFPINCHEVHLINHPSFVHMIYKMIKPMLRNEVKEKLIFHKGKLSKTLHKYVNPSLLPENLGGTLKNEEFCDATLPTRILQRDHFFLTQAKHFMDN